VYKRFHEKDKASTSENNRGYGGLTQTTDKDKEWMKDPFRLKPFAYPATRKNLTPAIKLHNESLPDAAYLMAQRR
jgi:hypothetical protein